ncbi:MAG: hypothetical protein ACRDL7_09440, partial [Gaiellaceae bacterium]
PLSICSVVALLWSTVMVQSTGIIAGQQVQVLELDQGQAADLSFRYQGGEDIGEVTECDCGDASETRENAKETRENAEETRENAEETRENAEEETRVNAKEQYLFAPRALGNYEQVHHYVVADMHVIACLAALTLVLSLFEWST